MSAVFIGTSSDCVCATKECASDTTRDAVVEGSGCERDLKLAWFRHGLLLQLTTVDTLPGNSTLHSAMCLNFYLLCVCPVKLLSRNPLRCLSILPVEVPVRVTYHQLYKDSMFQLNNGRN